MSITFNPDSPSSGADYSSGAYVNLDNVGVVLHPISTNQVEVWISFSRGIDKLHLVFDPASVKTLDGFSPETGWSTLYSLGTALEPYALSLSSEDSSSGDAYFALPGAVDTWHKVGTLDFTLQSGVSEIGLKLSGDLTSPDPNLGYYDATFASIFQGGLDEYSVDPNVVQWHWTNSSGSGDFDVSWAIVDEYSLVVVDGMDVGSHNGGVSLEAVYLDITPGSGIRTIDVTWSTTDMSDGSSPTHLYNVATPSATSASAYTISTTDTFQSRLPFSASWLPNQGNVTYYWRVIPRDINTNVLTPQYGSLSISDFDNAKAPTIVIEEVASVGFNDVFNAFAAPHYTEWLSASGVPGSIADVVLDPSPASLPSVTGHSHINYYVVDPDTGHGHSESLRVRRGYAPPATLDADASSPLGITVSAILGDSFGAGVAYAPNYSFNGQSYDQPYPNTLSFYRSDDSGANWTQLTSQSLPQPDASSPEVVTFLDETAGYGIEYWYKAVILPTSNSGDPHTLIPGVDSYADDGSYASAEQIAMDYSLSGNAEEGGGGTTIDFTANPGVDIDHLHFEVVRDGVESKSEMVYPSSPGASTGFSFLLSDFAVQHGSFAWTIRGVDSSHTDVATPITGTVTITESLPSDTTPPVITLLGSATETTSIGVPWSDPGYTASDDTDGDLTSDVTVGGDYVDYDHVGSYSVTYSVFDAAGNQGTATRTVLVEDLTLSAAVTVDSADVPSVTVTYGDSITTWNFSLKEDSSNSEYFGVFMPDTSLHPSPKTNTGSNNLPAGSYTWTLTGTSDQGQTITGNSGTLTVQGTLEISFFAVTADARPWDMSNVRWGFDSSVFVPSNTFVRIERKDGEGGSWQQVGSMAADAGGLGSSGGTGYHDSGLIPDSLYYYRLILTDDTNTAISGQTYTAEMEYSTISEPSLDTVDVDTRGRVAPHVTIVGSSVTHWYWTTETVVNPETRTKADWDADANAFHVDNTTGGITSQPMNHQLDSNGYHPSGAHTVTVCAFYGDGIPITADMSDPSVTDNTVHVVPFNTFTGEMTVFVDTPWLGSDWNFRASVVEPNDEYDWETLRIIESISQPSITPGVSLAPQGTVSSGAIVHPVSISGPDSTMLWVIPQSDENSEAIGTFAPIQVYTPKGVSSITATVTGDNLADDHNVSYTILPVSQFFFSPSNKVRISTQPPPSSGSLADWGTVVQPAQPEGNNSYSGPLQIDATGLIRDPGAHTVYAQACFDDDMPLGPVAQDTFTINQRAFTGLTDLKFSLAGEGVTLEAFGYFPQWRYYVGVLPYRTEAGSDMDADPHGVAVTEYVQTPDTEPGTANIQVDPDKKTVVVGVATDGQYLIGKPLIRVIYRGSRTAAQEVSIRSSLAPETFSPDSFAVAGIYGNELDEDGKQKRVVLSTSTTVLSGRLGSWASQGLTKDDFNNLLIRPNGELRTMENIAPYLQPRVDTQTIVLGTTDDGRDVYQVGGRFNSWSRDDGNPHMGIDFSAELVSDFAGVDNALVTLMTNPNGIETIKDIVSATAAVDLTGSGTGTLEWPRAFVEERVKEVRNQGLISRDFYSDLVLGKTSKKTGGAEGEVKYKRADLKDLYPGATLGANNYTREAAEAQGYTKKDDKTLYQEGFVFPKVRSGVRGAVSADQFLRKAPVMKTATAPRLNTASAYAQSTVDLDDLSVLDFLNDRPSGGLAANIPTQTSVTREADPTTWATEMDAASLAHGTSYLTPRIEYVSYFNRNEIRLDDPGVEPEFSLFESWHAKPDEGVPIEILNHHLGRGYARTQERLQRVYDLEKTAVSEVVGSGRNRTEWKETIIDYATSLGFTINE